MSSKVKELMTWSSDLSVGVPEIDEQHKHLVELLNRMNSAIREHRGSEESQIILQELAEYTRVHFTTEESLMSITNYPFYDSHRQKHKDLIHQVVDLQNKIDSGKAKISFELLHFLRNWLVQHIKHTDKHLGDYFVNNRKKEVEETTAVPQENNKTRSWWRMLTFLYSKRS